MAKNALSNLAITTYIFSSNSGMYYFNSMILGHINSVLTQCSLLVQYIAKALELQFPYLFSHSTISQVFAAAIACHIKIPKIRLHF